MLMASSEGSCKIIEHVVVVALSFPNKTFKVSADCSSHHARGPEVEYVYPPLSNDCLPLPSSPTNESSKKKSSSILIPSSWHLLPFMALPDGAHMVPTHFSSHSYIFRAKRITPTLPFNIMRQLCSASHVHVKCSPQT